ALPPRMLKMGVAMYRPKLSSRMMVVLKRKWGMNPPTSWEESSRETWRGATASLQYGQTRSLIVMNARQCGHMRRESISTIIRCMAGGPGKADAVWYNRNSRDGENRARVSRRYLPDRPFGFSKGMGRRQRWQYR